MSNVNSIGLTELIEQVKQELLTPSPHKETDIPVLSVDSVELELQVTIKKEGKGGVKIYVLDLGGGGSRDDVQRVKVKLSPIVSKKALLGLYKQHHPEQFKQLLEELPQGIFKGGSYQNLNDLF